MKKNGYKDGTKPRGDSGMVEGYDITIGGSQGANPQVGELHRKGVPATEVRSALKEILIEQFGAKPKAA